MVYFWRESFSIETYGKLRRRKYEPYRVLKALGSNAYLIEL